MLETIRELALEQLEVHGEVEATRRAHAMYFVELVETIEPTLFTSEEISGLDRLEAAHDDLRTAIAWATERGEAMPALRLVGGLYWFWAIRGYLSEGAIGSRGRSRSVTRASAPHANASAGAGLLAWACGEGERADSLWRWPSTSLSAWVAWTA
jgi:predicted ATPase